MNKKISTKYDLEKRILKFSKNLIKVLNKLSKNTINFKLVDQCIRAGTSLGANYREANETETKKDFKYKIYLCRKEAKETSYWIELLITNNFQNKVDLQ